MITITEALIQEIKSISKEIVSDDTMVQDFLTGSLLHYCNEGYDFMKSTDKIQSGMQVTEEVIHTDFAPAKPYMEQFADINEETLSDVYAKTCEALTMAFKTKRERNKR
jgi:hypothetical protein